MKPLNKNLPHPPKILISFLTFQSEKKIRPSLNSILNQNYKNFEIIISDNGSLDQTRTILENEYSEIKKIYNNNIGYGNAHNKIIQKAIESNEFSYILIMNDDVILEPHYLKECLNSLEINPLCAGCTGILFDLVNFEKINKKNKGIDFYYLTSYYKIKRIEKFTQLKSSQKRGIVGTAALFKLSALETLNFPYYDPNYFLYHEDIDLCWRLTKKGYIFIRNENTFAYHLRSYSFKKRYSVPKKIRRLVYLNRYFSIYKNASIKEVLFNLPFIFIYEFIQFIFLLLFDFKCLDIYWEFYLKHKKLKLNTQP